jgi:hypothetical protein
MASDVASFGPGLTGWQGLERLVWLASVCSRVALALDSETKRQEQAESLRQRGNLHSVPHLELCLGCSRRLQIDRCDNPSWNGSLYFLKQKQSSLHRTTSLRGDDAKQRLRTWI